MKPLTVALAALAVFFLALSMIASAPAPAPAAGTGMDRCLMCHPQAHPADWTQKSHVTELADGDVTTADCMGCHATSWCTDCHAQVKAAAAAQGSAAAASQPAATPATP
ncbi:MAG: hypothetical protein P4L93_05750 [Coriobacteriia bacterium]|nr:hypothetical protein [Coriobacteriia bacterium]